MFSANTAGLEEEVENKSKTEKEENNEKKQNMAMTLSMLVSLAFAVGLFVAIPYFIVNLIGIEEKAMLFLLIFFAERLNYAYLSAICL